MTDIWQQFHRLPRPIRNAVASPTALAAVERLEATYPDLDAANLVMRVMVKEVPVDKLAETITNEAKLDGTTAAQIAVTLKDEVFAAVKDYLGIKTETTPLPPSEPPAVKPTIPLPPMAGIEPVGSTAPAPIMDPQPAPVEPKPASPTSDVEPRVPSPPAVARTMTPPPPKVPDFIPASPVGPIAPTQAFSEEEAKEIEEQSKKLKQLDTTSGPMDLEDIAQAVLTQHQLAFPDEMLAKRAVTIFKSQLKNIRSADDTAEVLSRDPKIGGLGLDPDVAINVTATLDQKARELKNRGMVENPLVVPPLPPPPMPAVSQARPSPKPPLRSIAAGQKPTPPPPLPAVTEAPRPSRPIKRPSDIPPPPPLPTPPPTIVPPSKPIVQRNRVMERPQVADITKPTRTYGPAEEMRSLTLADWRRMGQGAAESAKHLLDRFQHLQQESFKLWTDAVSGWRQSEIYQLYLAIGRQSLEENIGIEAVIKKRAQQNQPYLSEHEFFVLTDLNRQLQT